MAAAVPAPPAAMNFNQYLQDVCGVANANSRLSIIAQGITGFAALSHMTSNDLVRAAKLVRRPGVGVGRSLPAQAEKWLEKTRYEVKHCERIQRRFEPEAGAVVAQLRTRLDGTWTLQEQELQRDKDKLAVVAAYPEPCLKEEDIRKTLEDIDEWAKNSYGSTGLPLAYILRWHADLPEHVDGEEDPGYGLPSRKEEMIRRGPHAGPVYPPDNNAVWSCLRHVFYNGPVKNWIKGFANAQDGRNAYYAIKDHYLNTGFQNRIKAQADHTLNTIFYNGKSKGFSFEKFTSKLKGAFLDLAEHGDVINSSCLDKSMY